MNDLALSLQPALLSTVLSTPFSRVQAILQTQDVIPSLRFGKPMQGVVNCLQRIRQEEGVRFLWRSAVPCFITQILRQTFDNIRNGESGQKLLAFFKKNSEGNDKTQDLLSKTKAPGDITSQGRIKANSLTQPGLPLAASVIAWSLILHPFEMLQVRLACDYSGKGGRQYTGMVHAAQNLIKAGGIRTLYKGYLPNTLVLLLEKNLFAYFMTEKREALEEMALAFGRDATLYPFLVLTSRLMMVPGNPIVKYKGILDCIRVTYRDFGIKGFYKGFQINLFTYALSTIFFLTTIGIEKAKKDK